MLAFYAVETSIDPCDFAYSRLHKVSKKWSAFLPCLKVSAQWTHTSNVKKAPIYFCRSFGCICIETLTSTKRQAKLQQVAWFERSCRINDSVLPSSECSWNRWRYYIILHSSQWCLNQTSRKDLSELRQANLGQVAGLKQWNGLHRSSICSWICLKLATQRSPEVSVGVLT